MLFFEIGGVVPASTTPITLTQSYFDLCASGIPSKTGQLMLFALPFSGSWNLRDHGLMDLWDGFVGSRKKTAQMDTSKKLDWIG